MPLRPDAQHCSLFPADYFAGHAIPATAQGVNVSGLLLPAGVVAAIASRDLSHNFLAGFFLMMVQPFRQAWLARVGGVL